MADAMPFCTRDHDLEKRQSVLVIDDDATVCNVVAAMASQAFEVSAVANRDAALPLLKQHFDIVLMDCQMPGMSAADFLPRLRGTSPASHVILMSGCFNESEATGLGIRHFLPKPFAAAELLGLLKGLSAAPLIAGVRK